MDRRQRSPALAPRHDASSRIQKNESIAEKMAALKARVAAAIGSSKAKGGLNVGLHPALEDPGKWKPGGQSQKPEAPSARSQSGASKAANQRGKNAGPSSANQDQDKTDNPYLDEATAGQITGGRNRQPRQLVFNQKGKYIQQAAALRRQAALEEMKKRIAANTRRAGIDEDVDSKQFVVEAPPDVEWWDEGLVSTYDDIEGAKIGTPDSIITEFIQHPVALEPPQEKNMPAPKPMYLTKDEQKKVRRQRRMQNLKEEQAKQRLGLIPAPAPKVKKGNLMRVLGEQAVKDPTAVEARVNEEIKGRLNKHLQTNEERKLSDEQKHKKLAENQQKDAAKGIHVLVFKIGSLANGQHRYKIGMNAEQQGLTGICIMHPKFCLVFVEGGEHSIRKYKRLMLNRIDWKENAPSREKDGLQPVARDWLVAEDERGELRDLSLNECKLVFEGEEKARVFRKWGSKVCETEAEAREVLSRSKLENFWSLAKGYS